MDHQTDNLILLVGSNPLCNAVAAQVLAKPGGKITLAHSKSLGSHDDRVELRLKAWLEEKKRDFTVSLKQIDDESDPLEITRAIKSVLAEATGSVGLNYTGGTKTMSVHSHQAVRDWASTVPASRTVQLSYLDARKLRLVFNDGESIFVGSEQIALKDMAALHGRTIDSHQQEARLPNSAAALAKAFSDKSIRESWETWRLETFFPVAKKWGEDKSKAVRCNRDAPVMRLALFPKDKWQSKTELNKLDLALPDGDAFSEFVCAIRQETAQDSGFNIGKAATQGGFKEPDDLCAWLDGVWLEHWVFQAFRDCLDLGLSDLGIGLNLDVRQENPKANFEFDVAAVRGYQLFACSCTVSSEKGLCKHKLFEAFLRARQLGGDEARIALVCCYDDPVKLENEIARDIDSEGRIRVFVTKDLPHLPELFRQWIKQQSHLE